MNKQCIEIFLWIMMTNIGRYNLNGIVQCVTIVNQVF